MGSCLCALSLAFLHFVASAQDASVSPGGSSGAPRAALGASSAVTVIYSNVPGSPTAAVPGMPFEFAPGGSATAAFDRPFGTPAGPWILGARMETGATTDDQIVVLDGAVAAREGDPAPWAPGEAYGVLDTRLEVNEAGEWVFATNTNGPTAADEYVVRGNSGGGFTVIAKEGDAIPAFPGTTFGDVIETPVLLGDGRVGLVSDGIDGAVTSTTDEILVLGVSLLAQEGVTVPSGQAGGRSEAWENFDLNDFFATDDGLRWLAQGDLTGPTTTDAVLVVDGAVVLQEGVVVPGSGFAEPIDTLGIVGVFLDEGGNWYARGNNDLTEADWVVRNGVVIAQVGQPIAAGATEVWSDAEFPDCFFLHVGNAVGDYVLGGVTDAPGDVNGVLVRNGVEVLCREGDPLDLDGNGLFDDDAFVHNFGNDDAILADDGSVHFVATVRNGVGTAFAQVFARVDPIVASLGTPLCFGDGSGAPCGCGNETPPGSGGGCASSTGQGARLSMVGSDSTGDVTLVVTDAPPGARGIFFQGVDVLGGGAGATFGDGLRCCGGSVIKLGAVIADATGSASTDGAMGTPVDFDPPIWIGCAGSALPGQQICYQFWYCDDGGGSPCGTDFNLTNAVAYTWSPGLGSTGDCGSGSFDAPCDIDLPEQILQEPGPLSCPPLAPNECGGCGQEVAVPIVRRASGELQLVETDARLPGIGMPFLWQRQYRSRTGAPSASGMSVAASYDVRVEADGADRLLHDGQGRVDRYVLQPDGTWVSGEFQRVLRAVRSGGSTSYRLEFEDAGTWELAPLDGSPAAGKLTRVLTRNGDAMDVAYDGAGRVEGVTDALGRSAAIQYDSGGRVASVTDPVGRTTTYAYYGSGDPDGPEGALMSVTGPPVLGTPNGNDFPSGKTTVYTYTTGFADERLNGDLLTITDPLGRTWLQNEYAHTVPASDPRHTIAPGALHFDRIVRQTLGDAGDLIDFYYEAVVPEAGNGFAVVKCIENDRVGNVTETWFDALNREVLRREWTGRADPDQYTSSTFNRPTGKLRPGDPDFFETRAEYNELSLPTRLVNPNGDETLFVYELELDPEASVRARGNLRELRRLPGPLGGTQTEIARFFEYDVDHGGCCGSNFVTRSVDGNGDETLHEYDAQGNRTRTTHPVTGVVEDFEYDAHGRMTAHVHPDDGTGHRRRDEFHYPPSGPQAGYLQAQVVDAGGLALATTYEYDAAGNAVRVVDPLGRDRLYTYNALDQVVRVESPEVTPGGVRYVEDTFYDASDNVMRVERDNLDEDGTPRSPARLGTSYEYEVLNQVVRQSVDAAPSGQVETQYAYDANRNRVLVRNPEAVSGGQPTNETAMLYDERDLLFRTLRAPDDAGHSTTQLDYDGNGNQTAVRAGLEAVPRVTTMEYDGYDRLVRATDAMGNVTRSTYDANGNLVQYRRDGELLDAPGSSGNVRLAETNYTYDAMNRRIREDAVFFDPATQAPFGDGARTRTTQLAPNSQVIQTLDDHGHATVHAYDGAWRHVSTTDAKGNVTMHAYDAASNLVSTTEVELSDRGGPAQTFTTTYDHDGLDRVVLVTDSIGGQRHSRYDSRGNRVLEVDELGHETRFVYDGLDRLVATAIDLDGDGARQSDTDDIVLLRLYDQNSRLTGQIDDNGNTTGYVYDALDRRTRIDYADGTAALTDYDVHGDAVSSADANGTNRAIVHDSIGRPSVVTVQPGVGVAADTTFESYAYDGLSRWVRAEDDDSLVTRVYDSLGGLRSETQAGDTVLNTLDAEGNRLQCIYPGGRTISCTFDELHREASISDAQGLIASYAYIGPRRVERRAHGNGTSLEYAYDGLRRVARTRHVRMQDGTVIDERTYLWDPVGNKLQRKDVRPGGPGFTHDYTYDRAHRLVHTSVTAPSGAVMRETSYELDGVHNRMHVTERAAHNGTVVVRPLVGSYDMSPIAPDPSDRAMNQYTTTPFDRRKYDSNGNLVMAATPNGAPTLVQYDHRNRMVVLVRGPMSIAYQYDVLGRRTQKLVDDGTTGTTTLYRYDGWREIEDRDVSRTLATRVYGTHLDEPISEERSEQDSYYHTDDLSDVMALTDALGQVQDRYDYADYGQVLDPSTLAPLSAGRDLVDDGLYFNARRLDVESGWYYYRTRFMEPLTGRFASRDSIGIWGDSSNLGSAFAYVAGRPVSALDPLGTLIGLHGVEQAFIRDKQCSLNKDGKLKVWVGLADFDIFSKMLAEEETAKWKGYLTFTYSFTITLSTTSTGRWAQPDVMVTEARLPGDGFNWRAADQLGVERSKTCVEELVLSGHGSAIQRERGKLKNTKFCKPCKIYLAGCCTQDGAQEVANATGCKVYGTKDCVKAGKWTPEDAWSAPASPE